MARQGQEKASFFSETVRCRLIRALSVFKVVRIVSKPLHDDSELQILHHLVHRSIQDWRMEDAVDILMDFLECAVHTILHTRQIYPSHIFEQRMKYGTNSVCELSTFSFLSVALLICAAVLFVYHSCFALDDS